MERFISVDTGKFGTKCVEYDAKKDSITRKFSIRTKVSEGDFRDDAIEENTVVVKIGDKTYKVGNGARGQDAGLETSKTTETHKICLLTALATLASSKEVDDINVAVGLPITEWASIDKREKFKEFMFPKGDITVEFKKDSASPVIKKTFRIKNGYAFPESQGAIWQDGIIENISPTSLIGVIDLGNLNLNATMWQGWDIVHDQSTTADLGGAILIQEIAQEISANILPCNELVASNIITSGDLALPKGANVTTEQIDLSRDIVKRVLSTHVNKIKRVLNSKNWSLDVTNLVAIGGTSRVLEKELKEAFGNIIVLDNADYCNATGYLRLMCAKILDRVIPLGDAGKQEKKEKEELKKAS